MGNRLSLPAALTTSITTAAAAAVFLKKIIYNSIQLNSFDR